MADVRCPKCGKSNPPKLETCRFCGGSLEPLSASTPVDSEPIKPGENPVKKNTSEFEKVKPAQGDVVRLGEAPTIKGTAELESTLPSWLRSLHNGKDPAAEETPADESSDQSLPLGSEPATEPDSSGDLPDWLSGLDKAASDDEEEAPDWLTSYRDEKEGEPAPDSVPESESSLNGPGSLSAGTGDIDWLARIGGEPRSASPESTPQEHLQGKENTPDLLDALKSKPALPNTPEQPVMPQDEDTPGWLSGLSGISGDNPPSSSPVEDLPDWLDQLKGKGIDSESTPSADGGTAAAGDVPDWLSKLESTPGLPEAASGENMPPASLAENLPDWLNQPKEKTNNSDVAPPADEGSPPASDIPDRLPNFGSAPGTPKVDTGENLPEWLSNLEAKTGPGTGAPAPIFSSELPHSGTAPDEIPIWLSQFQADVNAAEEQAAPSPEQKMGAGSLPDWQAGAQLGSVPSDGTTALIASDEGISSEAKAETAFSMETPDWLSKFNPEQGVEKPLERDEKESSAEDIEVSALPSWVQAMRPMESVVAEAGSPPQEDTQSTEQSGPLAGLQGVLPVGPGLGALRKPPAYSTLLNVTDGQQRYATAFERLISSETQPQVAKRTHLAPNRLWRWLIAGILILAVGLPLVTGIPATPASTLRPPEMVNAFTLVSSLPSNAPVLVVFDYDPALSGELEAAAAPLMDHLLLQGPRLALISTSPTGPALAERFLTDKNASPLVAGHNYQAGQQYVNLGYLAGGPSGVLYFASSPAEAAPSTLDGQPAWRLPPLQGIQKLSDFAAIFVLTDDADRGRVWIEQTSSTIGNTPMLMVISAQAEPLILPYYDSGQINGLVTGLAGGEAYGQTFIRPDAKTSLAQHYWNSFSTGTLVAEILIIIGALWSAFKGWRARRNKSGKGA